MPWQKVYWGFGFWRGFLGISEAGNFPAAIKSVAEWFPKKERALATGIFNSGTNVGAIVAPLAIPAMVVAWGWQSAFIITGAIGFIWVVLWFIFYEVPEKHKKVSAGELAYIHSDADEQAETKEKVPWLKLLNTARPGFSSSGKVLLTRYGGFTFSGSPAGSQLSEAQVLMLNHSDCLLPLYIQ